MAVDEPRAAAAVRELLIAIGEDPERDGLLETPDRVARAWGELLAGHGADVSGVLGKTFDIAHDEMVLVKDIEVVSLCEHHLLPFSARVAMGYIARDRVLGLSKFARIAHKVAHRLQIQERLVDDIAGEIERVTGGATQTGYRWYVLAILTIAQTCHGIDRAIIGLVLKPLGVEFQLTGAQLGLLAGGLDLAAQGLERGAAGLGLA